MAQILGEGMPLFPGLHLLGLDSEELRRQERPLGGRGGWLVLGGHVGEHRGMGEGLRALRAAPLEQRHCFTAFSALCVNLQEDSATLPRALSLWVWALVCILMLWELMGLL